MAASEDVTAPTRYGRRSENRGNTYTMVFSCSALPGQAKVVPCSRMVRSGRDLIAEAEQLWAAEQARGHYSTSPRSTVIEAFGKV
jgi:hypothetical protein